MAKRIATQTLLKDLYEKHEAKEKQNQHKNAKKRKYLAHITPSALDDMSDIEDPEHTPNSEEPPWREPLRNPDLDKPQVRRLGGLIHESIRKIWKAISKFKNYQEDILHNTGQHLSKWSNFDDTTTEEDHTEEEAIRCNHISACIRNVGGSLFLKSNIGSQVIWTLVDGGANINLIRLDVYQDIVRGMDQVTRESLEVKHKRINVAVANEDTWQLERSVILTIWAEGKPIRGRFWITDRLSDDIILGLPTQREYSMSVHTRTPDKGGDTMQIREFDDKHIRLFNIKGGIRSGEIPLGPATTLTIKARTRQEVKLKILGDTQIAWPSEEGEVTGITETSTEGPPGLRVHKDTAIVALDPAQDRTTVTMTNFTNKDIHLAPGDIIANFKPRILRTVSDDKGNTYLFEKIDGTLCKKVHPITTDDLEGGDWKKDFTKEVWRYDIPGVNPIPIATLDTKLGENKAVLLTEPERKTYLEKHYTSQNRTPVKGAQQEANRVRRTQGLQATYERMKVPLNPGEFHQTLEETLDENESGGDEDKTYPDFNVWTGIGDAPGTIPETVREVMKQGKEAFAEGGVVFPNPKMPDEYHLRIEMRPGLTPTRTRPYPMSTVKKREMDILLKEQLRKGIIEFGSSPYAVPTFLVPKPGNRYRVVVDLRRTNKFMVLNSWPLPKIRNIFDSLQGAKIFSVIDLRDAFYSIPVHKDSRDYCAFVTHSASYRYCTSPMGGATSANWFAYVLDSVLRDIKDEASETRYGRTTGEKKGEPNTKREACGVYNYLDDIIIYSEKFSTHMRLLRKVLKKLEDFGLRAKLSKTNICHSELKFLGRIVSEKGVRVDPDKVKAVMEMKKPEGRNAKSQLRSIIGGTNYYGSFIKNYSEKVGPLNHLLKKGKIVTEEWGEAQDKALEEIKKALSKSPILAYPNPDKPFIISTDASQGFVGCVLKQQDDQGKERVVDYGSSTLNSCQRAYPTHERELYAIVYAFHRYRIYVEGREDTKVFTDSISLPYIKANKYEDATGRLIRWFSFLDRFRFEVTYKKGTLNTDADMMTRAYDDTIELTEDPSAGWIFPLLHKYTVTGESKERLKVLEVKFPGPETKGIQDKLRGWDITQATSSQVREHTQDTGGKDTLVIGIPPLKTALLRKALRTLDQAQKWAIWAPIALIQERFFLERDVQLIVVKGGRSYGGVRGARLRGCWITHHCQLPSDIIFEKVLTKKGEFHTEEYNTSHSNVQKYKARKRRQQKTQKEGATDTETKQLQEVITALRRQPRGTTGATAVIKACNRLHTTLTSFKQERKQTRNKASTSTITEGTIRTLQTITKTRKGRHHKPEHIEEHETKQQEEKDSRDLTNFTRELNQELEVTSTEFRDLCKEYLKTKQERPFTAKVMLTLQQRDEECQKIMKEIEMIEKANMNPTDTHPERKQVTRHRIGFFMKDGILRATQILHKKGKLPTGETGERVYVPRSIRQHLISVFHRSPLLGHPGTKVMKKMMGKHYFWPGMNKEIELGVPGCLGCLRSKTSTRLRAGNNWKLVPARAMSVISLDLYGPLRVDGNGNTYVLVIVCNLTRWCHLIPMGANSEGHVDAAATANALVHHWIRDHSTPEIIISDRGPQFESNIWKELARTVGFQAEVVPADSHWRIGRPERLNRYMKSRFKIWQQKGRADWNNLLPFISMSHRFTPIIELGMSPFEILYGIEPRLPFTQINPTEVMPRGMIEKQVIQMHKTLKKISSAIKEIDERIALKRNLRKTEQNEQNKLEKGDQACWLSASNGRGKHGILWSDIITIQKILPGKSSAVIRFLDGSTAKVAMTTLLKYQFHLRRQVNTAGPLINIQNRMLHEGDAMGRNDNNKTEWIIPDDTNTGSDPTETETLPTQPKHKTLFTNKSEEKLTPTLFTNKSEERLTPSNSPLRTNFPNKEGEKKSIKHRKDLTKKAKQRKRLKLILEEPDNKTQESPTKPTEDTPFITNGKERRSLIHHQIHKTEWKNREYGDYWAYKYGNGWYLGMVGEEPKQIATPGEVWLRDMTATPKSITKGKATGISELVFATTWRKRKTGRTIQGTVDKPTHCGETGTDEIWNEVGEKELLGRVFLTGKGHLTASSREYLETRQLNFGHF